ncbi:hypothetical protein [Nocardia asteroides]
MDAIATGKSGSSLTGDPSLTRALAEALVDVLWFVEGWEDEQMDPD